MATTHHSRLHYLDSARGIAAMMVLVGHYISWKFDHNMVVRYCSLLVNENDAVSFFFVLSGFVLAYPFLILDKKMDIGKFYVNRFFRLYPGFLVAFLVNYIYSIRHDLNWAEVSKVLLHSDRGFWQEFFLLRGNNQHFLPGWTLGIEMAASFLIPFLILAVRYNKKLANWLLLAIFLGNLVIGSFMIHFALGVWVAANFNQISGPEFHKSVLYRYRVPLVLVAMVLFSLRKIDRLSAFGPFFKTFADYTRIDFFVYSGIASFIFLVYCIHFKGVQRVLESKLLLFYGKISYGIYLVHWVLVRFIYDYWDRLNDLLGGSEPRTFILLFFALLGTSTVLALAIYHWIELPFMRLGKKIAGRMKATVEI
ncbi:Acyltransferase family protein [compost metagenome]